MQKPEVLYHASPFNDLSELEPRFQSRPKDFNEGPVVFASSSKEYASFFLVPTTDLWTSSGTIGNVFYFLCGDKKKFMSLDHGGTMYTLPIEGFKLYRGFEWYSTEPVKPIKKIKVKSGLETMIKNGVQVYFVSGKKFKMLREGADHLTILEGVKSENENRGLPVRDFDYHHK